MYPPRRVACVSSVAYSPVTSQVQLFVRGCCSIHTPCVHVHTHRCSFFVSFQKQARPLPPPHPTPFHPARQDSNLPRRHKRRPPTVELHGRRGSAAPTAEGRLRRWQHRSWVGEVGEVEKRERTACCCCCCGRSQAYPPGEDFGGGRERVAS